MNVLVVEDDPSKSARVREVICTIVGEPFGKTVTARCVADAVMQLRTTAFDLVVVDLNVPVRTDEEARPDGGLFLLRALTDGSPGLMRPKYIVGLSAFDEYIAAAQAEFQKENISLIRYSGDSSEWSERLARQLVHIEEAAAAVVSCGYKCDMAILTAHAHTELQAILELPLAWERENVDGDDTVYHRAKLEADGKEFTIVACAAIDMGMPAATAMASKIIYTFRPKYIAMTGIAAGVSGHPGDIVIARQAWDYGAGKNTLNEKNEPVFLPDPEPVVLDRLLRIKAEYFGMKSDVLGRIKSKWKGTPTPHEIMAKCGDFASGAAVLENRGTIDALFAQHRKLIAIEMEAFGLFTAARVCSQPRPKALCVKSICDFGDTTKSDEHQRYAAFTSAQFLLEFAVDQLM